MSFDEVYNKLHTARGFLIANCAGESKENFKLFLNGKYLTIFHGNLLTREYDVFELSPYWNIDKIDYDVINGKLKVNVTYNFGKEIL